MDLGRNESTAWKGGYPFWGERDQSEWSDEVQERENGENGKGEFNPSVQNGHFGGLT